MRLLVMGAGGHAKVVIDAARAAGLDVEAVLGRPGDPEDVLGVRVAHDRTGLSADAFIVAVGDNAARAALYAGALEAGLIPATVAHPSAVISPEALIGHGTFIAPGVIVNAHARIGDNVILNTGCTIDHDCLVRDHAHVGPTVGICGGANIGEGALVGVGTCVIPLGRVGAWAVVGAGAAVTSDVPDRAVWGGVPAGPLHPMGDQA